MTDNEAYELSLAQELCEASEKELEIVTAERDEAYAVLEDIASREHGCWCTRCRESLMAKSLELLAKRKA